MVSVTQEFASSRPVPWSGPPANSAQSLGHSVLGSAPWPLPNGSCRGKLRFELRYPDELRVLRGMSKTWIRGLHECRRSMATAMRSAAPSMPIGGLTFVVRADSNSGRRCALRAPRGRRAVGTDARRWSCQDRASTPERDEGAVPEGADEYRDRRGELERSGNRRQPAAFALRTAGRSQG